MTTPGKSTGSTVTLINGYSDKIMKKSTSERVAEYYRNCKQCGDFVHVSKL
jgi:predicted esterase